MLLHASHAASQIYEVITICPLHVKLVTLISHIMSFNINNTSKFRGPCVTIPTSWFSFSYYYYPEGGAGGGWESSCKVMLFHLPSASRSVSDFSLYVSFLSQYQWLSCWRESEDHLHSLFLAWRLFSDNFVTFSGQLKCCLCHHHIQGMDVPACNHRLRVRAVFCRPAVPYVAVTNVCCGSADTWNVRIELLCQKLY